jgi:hypothetical protein
MKKQIEAYFLNNLILKNKIEKQIQLKRNQKIN